MESGTLSEKQERKEYEYPGDPVDPWAIFNKRGYRSDLKMPATPELG